MVRTSSLVEILGHKPTDKVASGLATFYDNLFVSIRLDALNLLEIGIDQGGSIDGWLEYFPNAKVWAIDKRAAPCSSLRERHADLRRLIILQGDPSNVAFAEEIFGAWLKNKDGFDIIIDDGSHINTEVFNAFGRLWPRLRSNGYYIVEDVQVPYRDPDYPTISAFFLNYAIEHNIKEADFRSNVLYLRKP